MGPDLEYTDGQTPLDEEEIGGLLIHSIATRGELDEFEQQNIEDAIQWSIVHKASEQTIFTEEYLCAVHRRMFSKVWRWAGAFRTTNKNLGEDRLQVSIQTKNLLDDVRDWHENKTYSPDETAMRFKHRIVSIQCFANGNESHSRLIADIIVSKIYKLPVFTWGARTIRDDAERRKLYLQALKSADYGGYGPLLAFARA